MKSERRHELQTNTLADWTGRQIDAVKPHISLIVTVVFAAVAVLMAWLYFDARNESQTTEAWSDFYQAAGEADAASLLEMAQRHAGEPASLWALLLAGDVQLAQGAERAFTDRGEAEKILKQAAQTYETVLDSGQQPLLRRRALYGLAEAHESLFAVTGDPEERKAALANYQKIAETEEWADTVLGRSATRKAELLARESTEDFLVWFSKQEPVQMDESGMPGGTAPGGEAGTPFDLSTLPGADELLLPDEEDAGSEPKIEAVQEDQATEETAAPATTPEPTAEESPKTEAAPQAEKAPEQPAGATDTPAVTEEPAEETPPLEGAENAAAPQP